jgi:hypothetical protein
MHFVRWPSSQRQDPLVGRRYGLIFQGSRMRIKFEAVDKNGKLHKRAGVSRVYSHCVVIHFADRAPNKFWPRGVEAYSRAQWAGTRELAERKASHWRKEAHVLEVEVLDARQV